jgi:hypothetical protein
MERADPIAELNPLGHGPSSRDPCNINVALKVKEPNILASHPFITMFLFLF